MADIESKDRGPAVPTKRISGIVAEGVHNVRIVDYALNEGPSDFYWAYTLQIQEDSIDNEKSLWANVSLSPKARWKMEEFLDAVGADGNDDVYGGDFLGCYMRVSVRHQAWGESKDLRANVDKFLPPSEGTQSGSKAPKTRSRKPKTPANAPKL